MKIIDDRSPQTSKTPEFYITNILSPSDILMRGGKDSHVDKGDYFDILDEPTKIIDPRTNKVLGSTLRYKYRMQVIDVWQNISRLTTTQEGTSNFASPFESSKLALRKRNNMDIAPKQKVDDVFSEFSHSAVKVGDSLVLDTRLRFGVRYHPRLK